MDMKEDKIYELAERMYDLDAEVYVQLGSSLGRVFTRDRDRCVKEMVQTMRTRKQGHLMRSELALIGNMARTIQDKETRRMIMTEYNNILQELITLPTSFAGGDVVDTSRQNLNTLSLKNRFSEKDHTIICIGRTYGSGGSEIGFMLADALKINFYDAEIFNAVLKRLEAEKDSVKDDAWYMGDRAHGHHVVETPQNYKKEEAAFTPNDRRTIKQCLKDFNRYHGLSKRDAVFFNLSDLLVDMAKKEDFIVMGRCADLILANNNIPHISIFITAPLEQRVRHIMDVRKGMTEKQCRHLCKQLDARHRSYYKFFTGSEWGNAVNYDICLNSACYGIEGSMEIIKKMISDNKEAEKN